MEQINNEIIQLKENIENVERKNSAFSIDLQDTFTGTSVIVGRKTQMPRHNDTPRTGAGRRLENGNSYHGNNLENLNITNKLQRSCLSREHTDEEMEECSFLETEKAQRK